MVTVTGYTARKNANGETFFVLNLLDGIEVHKSKSTGKNFLFAKRANMVCPFDDETCEQLIGTKIPGTIEKQPTQEYDYLVPGTSKRIKLSHTYVFIPDAKTE